MKPRKPIPKKRLKKRESKGLFKHLEKESKTDEWTRTRLELDEEFLRKGIPKYCELRLSGCTGGLNVAYAHSKKRDEIALEGEERVRELKEVIRACSNCHHKIEYPKEELMLEGENTHDCMYRIVTQIIESRCY